MTTFNIEWIGTIIYDPNLKQSETQYGAIYKLREAYESLKFRADATWEKFADTVTSIGRGFTATDYGLLKTTANKIERDYGVAVDYQSYQDKVVPAKRRDVTPYDTYSLAEVRSQTAGLEDSVTRHVLLVASVGVSIEQWQDAKDVTTENLILRNGKHIPLLPDEAELLIDCWHTADAYNDFYGMLDIQRRPEGDKNNSLHVHLSKHRGNYTYNQLLFVWELNRYLKNGIGDAESVSERTGISIRTCLEHPSTWKANGLISDETLVKLM